MCGGSGGRARRSGGRLPATRSPCVGTELAGRGPLVARSRGISRRAEKDPQAAVVEAVDHPRGAMTVDGAARSRSSLPTATRAAKLLTEVFAPIVLIIALLLIVAVDASGNW